MRIGRYIALPLAEPLLSIIHRLIIPHCRGGTSPTRQLVSVLFVVILIVPIRRWIRRAVMVFILMIPGEKFRIEFRMNLVGSFLPLFTARPILCRRWSRQWRRRKSLLYGRRHWTRESAVRITVGRFWLAVRRRRSHESIAGWRGRRRLRGGRGSSERCRSGRTSQYRWRSRPEINSKYENLTAITNKINYGLIPIHLFRTWPSAKDTPIIQDKPFALNGIFLADIWREAENTFSI